MKITYLLLGITFIFSSCKEKTSVTTTLAGTAISAETFNVDVNNRSQATATREDNASDYGMNCESVGAKSAYYLGLGDGYKTLRFKFTKAAWSNITNTCGWNEESNRFFTAPWPEFNQHQMFMMTVAPNGKFTMYSDCEKNVVFSVPTKPGYKYYVFVNDMDGKHKDNHGTISFCYSLE